jgi:uncharacterized protein/heat shock protein HslJ
MTRVQAVAGLVLALAAVPAASAARQAQPAFDCSKASGQVETLICGDAALATLDRRMAEVYNAAMKQWPADVAAEQRAVQRGWIKGRNDCWKDADPRACTEREYRTRIVELQIQSGQLMAPTPVGYACAGGESKPFAATFYADTDPKSAVLTWGDDQVIAFSAPAGSGAKYTAANVEFREHHGEATVDWFGTTMTCKVLSADSGGEGAAPPASRPFVGATWVLVEFQSMDDTRLKPEGDARFTLAFGNDGSVSVRADCNRGRGSWKSAGPSLLEFGPIALTRAACPPSPLEQRFVRDLGYVRSYTMRDGHLYLSLMADGGIYDFEATPPEP